MVNYRRSRQLRRNSRSLRKEFSGFLLLNRFKRHLELSRGCESLGPVPVPQPMGREGEAGQEGLLNKIQPNSIIFLLYRILKSFSRLLGDWATAKQKFRSEVFGLQHS